MKNFIILMAFTLLAFGSLFYVLSLYSGEDFTGMFSAISGDYKKRTGSSFLTNAEEGGRIAPPTRTGNCPMSTKEGRLIVNAPKDATVRILYAETGAELECRTGSFTKNICRSQFKIKSYKPASAVFEKTVFLGAGQIATVDVDLKPGNNNLLPCDGTASVAAETSASESSSSEASTNIQTETSINETTPENTPLAEQQSTPTEEQTTPIATQETLQPETTPVPQEIPVKTASVEQPQTTPTPEVSTVEATPTDVPLQEPTPSEETNSDFAST